MYYHIIYAAFRINQVHKKEATCCTMLTFPEISFPSPSLATPWFVFMLEQTSSARALREDIRHFLPTPSITGHCLCEDFRKDDFEAAAFLRFRIKLGFAAMKLGDVLHDSQSETGSAEGAAALLVDTVKTFEYPWLVFRGDSASVVCYGNDGGVPIAGQGQFDVGTAAVRT